MISCKAHNISWSYRIFWEYSLDPWLIPFLSIILLYIYLIYILMCSRSKKFKSGYFIIFITTGIIDVINAIATEYIRFSQRVGMGACFGWLLQFTTAVTGSNFAMHLTGNLLMTIFQFTAVWLPVLHYRLWSARNLLIMLVLMVGLPLVIYFHLLFTEFEFYSDVRGVCVYSERFEPIWKTRILDGTYTILQSISCTGMSLATVVGIRIKTAEIFQKTIPEKGLVLVELLNALFGILETMYSIISLLDINTEHNRFLHFIQKQFVCYFFMMITLNAFTLILLSGNVRKEIARRWICNKNQVIPFAGSTSRIFDNRSRL